MITAEIKKELKQKRLLPKYQEVAEACKVTSRTVAGVMAGTTYNENVVNYIINYAIRKNSERSQLDKSLLNILNS